MIAVTVLALALLSGGSDSPNPYTVDSAGITLPAGQTFQDHGHVNLVTSAGGKGIHFEALNNQPSGKWIGEGFIPWSAFGLVSCDTVSWVQLSQFNEHYGEGGQPAVTVGPCPESPEVPERPADDSGEEFECDYWTYWSGTWVLEGGEWVEYRASSKVPTTANEREAHGCEEFPPALPLTQEVLPETGIDEVERGVLWLAAFLLVVAGVAFTLNRKEK